MIDINGVSSIDNKNNYNINTGKRNIENSADFSSYLGETKSLDVIFKQAAKKYNVPENLLKAIGKAESSFNANAVSRCGAQGIMQLMPATAKELGVTNSFDPEQNIMGGAKYISSLLKKYDGDARLALAAYNAGSGNVAKYGGIPPFNETQNYVKKVMNYAGQGLDEEIALASTTNSKGNTGSNSPTSNISTVYAAQVPSVPVQNNLSLLISNSINSNVSDLQMLDSLLSYDDYLKFIDIFINDDKEDFTEDNKRNYSEKDNKINYSAKDINYNVPVMNLLKDQKLI